MDKKNDKLRSEFDEKLNEGKPAGERVERDASHDYRSEETTAPAADRTVSDDYRREETRERPVERTTIPVVEEQVHVGKKTVETGRVRISKDVHEEEVTVDLPTVYEEADVQRVPVNKYVETPPPPIRYEGDKMIIPVIKEVLVVEKRILVVEELHVTKRITESHEAQQVTLRKETVNVNRFRSDESDSGRV
ncbi:YsnF/AvaK domain-containing protein [Pontibacter ruber]|uniref:YsnF/AvaK domain-containing protein n=1 Tax=Pontibacter ruber TaxID=1343895 RepID=A0ABW5CZC0_9BACT|nr:YsnF/AvaK domain-containing protein [Pontibacter ruber]